jgi:hypothetical protein
MKGKRQKVGGYILVRYFEKSGENVVDEERRQCLSPFGVY